MAAARTTKAERRAIGARMRALIEAHDITVVEAGRRLGLHRQQAKKIANENNIVASACAIQRAMQAGARMNATAANASRIATAAETDARILALWERHTRAEIADILGLKVSRVKKAVERAKAKGKPPAPKKRPERRDYPALQAARAKRAADAERLRAAVAEGRTVKAAAAHIGMGITRARELAQEYKIRAAHDVLHQRMREGQQQSVAAKRCERNPFLTSGQQATVDRIKHREWTKRHPLGVPSAEEADRLVREWLARNTPTVCPAPRIDEPSNFGAKWR